MIFFVVLFIIFVGIFYEIDGVWLIGLLIVCIILMIMIVFINNVFEV